MTIQLKQNLSACQIEPESYSSSDREEIETLALKAKNGQTNWFQVDKQPLGAPRKTSIEVDDGKTIRVMWQTAYAADQPIDSYEVLHSGEPVGKIAHSPQIDKSPFTHELSLQDLKGTIQVVTIDKGGNKSPGELVELG